MIPKKNISRETNGFTFVLFYIAQYSFIITGEKGFYDERAFSPVYGENFYFPKKTPHPRG